jgi:hypothetical protein
MNFWLWFVPAWAAVGLICAIQPMRVFFQAVRLVQAADARYAEQHGKPARKPIAWWWRVLLVFVVAALAGGFVPLLWLYVYWGTGQAALGRRYWCDKCFRYRKSDPPCSHRASWDEAYDCYYEEARPEPE